MQKYYKGIKDDEISGEEVVDDEHDSIVSVENSDQYKSETKTKNDFQSYGQDGLEQNNTNYVQQSTSESDENESSSE